ncbi:hypothetical protein GQ53DRAFT_707521 [Thozetella sp. PMI_491]|nr:hypothetical protein GQ53DRAFT_707521 [Thozetella sp. PMI_491]
MASTAPLHEKFEPFSILTPNAMLGYGYNVDHFWYGVRKYHPAAIILDSGSTDGGPYKLGMGKMTCGRGSYIRDLEPILGACYHHKIKVLIGSVGGDGSNRHVREMLAIVAEISNRKGYSFKIATIDAGMERSFIKSRIAVGRVSPCGPLESLAPETVDTAVDIRRCLPSIAWHMGKILECGGICAVPKGREIVATMQRDSFDLTPLSPAERCTPLSVAAHTLYEKTRPDRLPGPGGVLDLHNAQYEQVTPKTCRVSGAHFIERPYQVKLEGVTKLGYRTIFVGGIRDPILISQIDDFLERVRVYTQRLFPELDKSEQCRLIYHVYGKNGIMGPLEPEASKLSHEIAVLGEVVAPTAELSHTIANNARASILHFPYPGQMATTGNLASPLSPHEQYAGAVFKFSLYHLVDLDSGEELSLFPITIHSLTAENICAPDLQTLSDFEFEELENGQLAPLTKKTVPSGAVKLEKLARIVRSKNSGPFELTLDVMFDDREVYQRAKAADLLTNDTIKKLYGIEDSDILTNMYFDPALAWKCTIKRPWAQGSVGERDTLGTQQHAPLLGITFPASNYKAVSADNPHEPAVKTVNGSMSQTLSTRNGPSRDRQSYDPTDLVRDIWADLELPSDAVASLDLPAQDCPLLPSSYKMGIFAQGVIALSALAAATVRASRNSTTVPRVCVPPKHAVIEFKSERLYKIDGKPPANPWGSIGGLHKTSDGYVRVHDSFPNHANGTLELLGLPQNARREQVTEKIAAWASIDLETTGTAEGALAIYALRSYAQWDQLPQSRAISDSPIAIRQISPDGPKGFPVRMGPGADKCLRGLRVVEMSRVIAAPLAGKTLAAHGADVLWVTSPNLPDIPGIDREFGRGKRTVSLDINNSEDKQRLLDLLADCDVFIQGFRPGSLAAYGLSAEELTLRNPSIICANMSAFGPNGPWAKRRGFDSLVQTCSGMNVSEAEHRDQGEAARPTCCQALDHAGGYLLATGIMAAVHKRAAYGGAWSVDASLAGAMKYLRSLGQYPGVTGFDCQDYERPEDVPAEYLETRDTGFGRMTSVRHGATIEGCEVGWEIMPKPLGSDTPEWL